MNCSHANPCDLDSLPVWRLIQPTQHSGAWWTLQQTLVGIGPAHSHFDLSYSKTKRDISALVCLHACGRSQGGNVVLFVFDDFYQKLEREICDFVCRILICCGISLAVLHSCLLCTQCVCVCERSCMCGCVQSLSLFILF